MSCPKRKKSKKCVYGEAGLCDYCGRDCFGRSQRDRLLIAQQSRLCLRYRRSYRAAKESGCLKEWLELATAKLLWLSVSSLRQNQSQLLYKAARERDQLISERAGPMP